MKMLLNWDREIDVSDCQKYCGKCPDKHVVADKFNCRVFCFDLEQAGNLETLRCAECIKEARRFAGSFTKEIKYEMPTL